jgi:hypothetical protein
MYGQKADVPGETLRDKAMNVAAALINVQGFLIIGTEPYGIQYIPGDIITKIFTVDVGHPFTVVKEATKEEADAQGDVSASLGFLRSPHPVPPGGRYWKLVTD